MQGSCKFLYTRKERKLKTWHLSILNLSNTVNYVLVVSKISNKPCFRLLHLVCTLASSEMWGGMELPFIQACIHTWEKEAEGYIGPSLFTNWLEFKVFLNKEELRDSDKNSGIKLAMIAEGCSWLQLSACEFLIRIS